VRGRARPLALFCVRVTKKLGAITVSDQGNSPRTAAYPLSLFLVLILAIGNALLLYEYWDLRSRLSSSEHLAPRLVPGDRVPSFEAQSVAGNISVEYETATRTQILLYLSPDCEYCSDQLPIWKDVVDQSDSDRFIFYVLVNDYADKNEVHRYVQSAQVRSTAILFIPQIVAESYRLFKTPTTIAVNANGVVERVWIGKWNDGMTANAEQFFDVEL